MNNLSTLQCFHRSDQLTKDQKAIINIAEVYIGGTVEVQEIEELLGTLNSRRFVYYYRDGTGSFYVSSKIFLEEDPVKAYKKHRFSLGISRENIIIDRLEKDLAKAKDRLRELQTKLKDLE